MYAYMVQHATHTRASGQCWPVGGDARAPPHNANPPPVWEGAGNRPGGGTDSERRRCHSNHSLPLTQLSTGGRLDRVFVHHILILSHYTHARIATTRPVPFFIRTPSSPPTPHLRRRRREGSDLHFRSGRGVVADRRRFLVHLNFHQTSLGTLTTTHHAPTRRRVGH